LGQAGIESTRGTAVAATRKVYATITPSYAKPLSTFQDTSGTFFDRRRAAYGREQIGFSALDIATFEDLPWWLQFFVKGGVTGVSGGGSPASYGYTFSPSAATDDLKSMTLEFNESGNPYESSQVMASRATLRMDADNDNEPGWMIDVELMGRDWSTTTFTGALTDRTTEVILARGTKLYINDTSATIGNTQQLGLLINCSITFTTGIHFKAFAENETGYAANKVGRNAYHVDAQFTFEFDSDTEFAKYRSSTPQQRAIRLSREGTAINATPTNKLMQIDLFNMLWSSWSRGDREGNLTAVFGAQGYFDATEANVLEILVRNALATLV
jgi:hypothetical protein